MLITYTLRVTSLDAYPSFNGLQNVVFRVEWSLEASDGVFATSTSGSTTLPEPDPSAFYPFSQLTKNIVLEWVRAHENPDTFTQCESMMAAWIAGQHNVPVVTLAPPWTDSAND